MGKKLCNTGESVLPYQLSRIVRHFPLVFTLFFRFSVTNNNCIWTLISLPEPLILHVSNTKSVATVSQSLFRWVQQRALELTLNEVSAFTLFPSDLLCVGRSKFSSHFNLQHRASGEWFLFLLSSIVRFLSIRDQCCSFCGGKISTSQVVISGPDLLTCILYDNQLFW